GVGDGEVGGRSGGQWGLGIAGASLLPNTSREHRVPDLLMASVPAAPSLANFAGKSWPTVSGTGSWLRLSMCFHGPSVGDGLLLGVTAVVGRLGAAGCAGAGECFALRYTYPATTTSTARTGMSNSPVIMAARLPRRLPARRPSGAASSSTARLAVASGRGRPACSAPPLASGRRPALA